MAVDARWEHEVYGKGRQINLYPYDMVVSAIFSNFASTTDRSSVEVLELGCGTGTTALIHAPFVKHITGVDISRNMLEIARAKADAADMTNVTFQQSSIDDLKAPVASFDVVMGHSILHLLENKEAVIARVHRMLKPGGVFVSSTACLGCRVPVLRAILPVGRFLGLLPLVKFFTAEELEGDLTDAGFRIDHRWKPGKGKGVFIVASRL